MRGRRERTDRHEIILYVPEALSTRKQGQRSVTENGGIDARQWCHVSSRKSVSGPYEQPNAVDIWLHILSVLVAGRKFCSGTRI